MSIIEYFIQDNDRIKIFTLVFSYFFFIERLAMFWLIHNFEFKVKFMFYGPRFKTLTT